LKTDSRLTPEQRLDISYRAISMHHITGETSRSFADTELEYEGRITTGGEFGSLGGGLWGQIYDAEVDAKFGKAKIRFMISEQTMGSRTSVSNN